MADLLAVTDENFETEILKCDTPAVVMFKSMGCPHCQRMLPIIEELADEYAGRAKLAILDVAEGRQKAIEYGILSVPQVHFFKDGSKIDEIVGAVPKEEIVKKMEALLQ